MHRLGPNLRLLLWFAALSLLLTWPTALYLNHAALGSPNADGIKHLWTLWWIRAEVLGQGGVPLHTTLVNYPDGMALYPIEPLNGLLACILFFVPIVAVANLAALLNLTLTGFCGALLGRELSRSEWGALASGTLLQCSAVSTFTVHVGVGELQHLWWLPLVGVAWLRLRAAVSVRAALWLAAALAGSVLSCFYHGLFAAMLVSALSLLTLPLGAGLPRLLVRYALAAGLSLAVVWPVTRAFAGSYGGGDPPPVGLVAYVLEEHGQPVTDPVSARLDPGELVRPARARRATQTPEEEGYGGGRYLGAPALLLALGALLLSPRRAAPWLVVGAAGGVLALGSYLAVGGEELLLSGGSRVRLPLLHLNRALGYVAEPINFPVRALALSATALAACAGLLVAQGWTRLAVGLALLSAAEVQVNQVGPWPMRTLAPWEFPELEPLAEGPPGPIADLSLVWRADKESRWASLSAQMAHGQAIQGVPVERVEYFAQSGRFAIAALPLVQDLAPAQFGSPSTLSSPDYRADLALLRAMGFTRVQVLGLGGERRVLPEVHERLTRILGPPEVDSAVAAVWRIPEVQHSAEELQAWQAAQQARVDALMGRTQTTMGPQLR